MPNNKKNPEQNNRRRTPLKKDALFRVVIALNTLVWALMIVALVLYHQGRPEMMTGLHEYWGIKGREEWVQDYYDWLIALLQLCLVMSLITLVLRSRRSRRKSDHLGFNLFFLIGIITISLFTLLA